MASSIARALGASISPGSHSAWVSGRVGEEPAGESDPAQRCPGTAEGDAELVGRVLGAHDDQRAEYGALSAGRGGRAVEQPGLPRRRPSGQPLEPDDRLDQGVVRQPGGGPAGAQGGGRALDRPTADNTDP